MVLSNPSLHCACRQVKEGKKPKFKLGVADAKLGAAIQDETSIPCVCNEFTGEVRAAPLL